MQLLRVYDTNPDRRHIERAVEALRRGELIVYPTDTVYALGCSAVNGAAVERLCRAKGIDPRRNTLSVVCSGLSQASEYARIDNQAFKVIKPNVPGAFTFVLPATTRLPKAFKERKELGLRVPECNVARLLAEELGSPVLSASTGAFDSGAEELFDLPAVLMLDAGEIDGQGEPTTVVGLTPEAIAEAGNDYPPILRQGRGWLA